MPFHQGLLDPVEGFAVDGIGLATDRKRNAGGGKKIAFIGSIDEHRSLEAPARFHGDGGDLPILKTNSLFAIEPFSIEDFRSALPRQAVHDRLGHLGLKDPHRLCIGGKKRSPSLDRRFDRILERPGRLLPVMLLHPAVKLSTDTADGFLAPRIRCPESVGGETANVVARFDEDHLPPHPGNLHSCNHTGAGSPVDHHIGAMNLIGGRQRNRKENENRKR